MLAPKIEDANKPNYNDLPKEVFTFEELKIHWRRYAFEVKNQGKESFYSALTRREPKQKSEQSYIMEVDNQIQINSITPILSELVEYLRKGLKNYDIDIKLELTNTPDEDTKFLTGKDKFAALARKNPNLHALKKKFNLDIEF